MYYRKKEDQKRLKKLDGFKSWRTGVWYNDEKGYYIKYYKNGAVYKRLCNRKLRRKMKRNFDQTIQHNQYRKNTEYWWVLF